MIESSANSGGGKMSVMGIYLTADLMRIVTLSGTKKEHTRVESKFHKLVVPRNNDKSAIDMIVKTLKAFWQRNEISAIAINGRAIAGRAAGSPLSFKSEGLLLAITEVMISNVFSATIRATNRKMNELKSQRVSTNDLGIAYDLAFEMLPE